ncbi:MAG: uncharacterized protein QOE28_269 [Solirubrobacteraceae bacterium]|jgi:uncharacterized protein YceH (UPF0502 family)|nr:uncharacterized protein [Solirubrobacteraceae bacterium]
MLARKGAARVSIITLARVDLDAVEVRVLGCLIEKQRTTPDAYPLSLNGLRLACNQSTNRDPVVAYTEHEIREALARLGRRRWTRLASGAGSRAAKYRHLLDEAPGIGAAAQAVLAVLALRGPQTPGELRARTERMHRFPDHAALQETLDELARRGLAVRHERRPGQKEERYAHLLSDDLDDAPVRPAPVAAAEAAAPAPPPPGDDRIERLEAELAELRDEVARLRALIED